MSAKELKFYGTNGWETDLFVEIEDSKIKIELVDTEFSGSYKLDRNQAHLLMLYLQEHLAELKIPELIKGNLWRCGCGQWHKKDFVCERIGD